MGFVLVLKLWSFLSNQAQSVFSAFHLLILMIISFQTHICKWQENVGLCVIKITCNTDRSLIALKHTNILYFKGVWWMFYDHFGAFVCLCLCTSPSEPIHSWQSRILYFSTVPAAAHRHSAFGLRCAMPAGTQPIRPSAPCLKTFNIQSEHHHPSKKKTKNKKTNNSQ